MKRIYADFNDIAADGTLPLTCAGSIESISAQAEALRDDEEVVLSDGEVEVLARVFCVDGRTWAARSDWKVVEVMR